MKTNFIYSLIAISLLLSAPAFAQDLSCTSKDGDKISVSVSEDKVTLTPGYGDLTRERDPSVCSRNSSHYACYELGQMMVNIPLALAAGEVNKGTIYVQSDADDNTDSHNFSLLGEAYRCVAN